MKRKLPICFLINLVLFTPFVYSGNLYNGIVPAKQIWFFGAMSLLTLAFGIDLLINKRNVTFCLNNIDKALLVFYSYLFIRTIFTPYIPLLHNTRFVNYSLLLIFYFIVKYTKENWAKQKSNNSSPVDKEENGYNIYYVEILVDFLMLTGFVQATWGLLQLYGFLPSFHSGFKITGTFFNPAPYALYLAAIFPIALGRLLLISELKNERINNLNIVNAANLFSSISQFFHSLTPSFLMRKTSYYLSLFTVVAIILVLPATMNRASWLGVIAGSLLVLNYRYNLIEKVKTFMYCTTRKLFVLTIIFLIVGFSFTGLYFLKKGSSDGKLLIWEVSLGKITEKPLFGYGVGRFEAEYNNWQADYFRSHPGEMDGPKGMVAGNTKYCFNEYLEIVCELGIIGLFLFLVVIVRVLIIIKREIKETQRDKNGDYNLAPSIPRIIIIPSLLSVLVCGLISFPFYSLPTQIVFFILLAVLSSQVERIHLSERFKVLSFIQSFTRVSIHSTFIRRSFCVVGLSTLSIFLFIKTKQDYKAYKTWDESVMIYQAGSYEEACKSYQKTYVPLQYNGYYLQYYGKALLMSEDYSQIVEIHKLAANYTSDDILYCNLGDAYKVLKRYSEAEEAYLHGSFMVPHKLYPLYLLTILYDETGQREKALTIARQVLKKEVKVESQATEEIRIKMREIINKSNN